MMAVATRVSRDMSIGSETAVVPGDEGLTTDVVRKDCRAECSWAE